MRNLIPNYILEKNSENKVRGSITASAMYIHISGFKNLTNNLVKMAKKVLIYYQKL